MSELRRRSRDAGMRVLAAQGGELEGDYGFGVVRQLFDPVLLGARDTDRDQVLAGAAQLAAPLFGMVPNRSPTGMADADFARLHGLHWLVANLADAARCSWSSTTPTGPTSRRCASSATSPPGSRASPS